LNPHPSVTRTLALLLLVTGLLHVAFMSARVTIILYAIELDTAVWLVGLLQGMYPAAGALLSVPAGRLIDRYGPHRLMQLGAAATALLVLLPVMSPSAPALFLTAFCLGGVVNVFYLASLQVLARLCPPEDRVSWLSWNSVTFSAGSFLAPLLSGLTIDRLGHGWALAFGALPAFGVFVALASRSLELPGPSAAGAGSAHGGIADMLRQPQIRAVVFIGAFIMVIWDLHGFAVPVYGTQLGLSATTIGLVLSALSISMLASRALVPWFARRLAPVKLMTFALALSATGFLLYPFASGVAAMIVLTSLIGLGCGINHPLSNLLLIEHAPEGRSGEAFGFRNTVSQVLQIGMPLAMGALSAATGIAVVFWLTAGTGYAGIAYAKRMWPLFARGRAAREA
jgi:MFS family permease